MIDYNPQEWAWDYSKNGVARENTGPHWSKHNLEELCDMWLGLLTPEQCKKWVEITYGHQEVQFLLQGQDHASQLYL